MDPITGIALAVGGAGLGFNIFNQIEAGDAAAAEANREAALRREAARETLDRAKLNEKVLRDEGADLVASVEATLAKSGGPSVSGFALYAKAAERVRMEIVNQRREAEFRARQIILGAESIETAGQNAQRASLFGAIGTGLSGVGQLGLLGYKAAYPGKTTLLTGADSGSEPIGYYGGFSGGYSDSGFSRGFNIHI